MTPSLTGVAAEEAAAVVMAAVAAATLAVWAAVAVISLTAATSLAEISTAATAVGISTAAGLPGIPFHDGHGHRFGFAPFYGDYFGDYGYYGSDCWSTQYRRRVWVCD